MLYQERTIPVYDARSRQQSGTVEVMYKLNPEHDKRFIQKTLKEIGVENIPFAHLCQMYQLPAVDYSNVKI